MREFQLRRMFELATSLDPSDPVTVLGMQGSVKGLLSAYRAWRARLTHPCLAVPDCTP